MSNDLTVWYRKPSSNCMPLVLRGLMLVLAELSWVTGTVDKPSAKTSETGDEGASVFFSFLKSMVAVLLARRIGLED